MCCSFLQVLLGRILHVQGMPFAMLTQWVPLTVSGFLPFGHLFLQWSGWASLLAGEEHLRGF